MARWTAVKFGDVMKPNRRPFVLGPAQDADLIGVRWYGEGAFHREKKEAMKIQKKDHFVVRKGDVVYNKLFAWKGSFAIIAAELDGMFASDKFPTYRLDESRVHPGFLRWFFRVPALWESARVKSKGSAAISKLTLNPPEFLELDLPMPENIDEQQKIAERLDFALESLRRVDDAHERGSQAIDAFLVSARDRELATLPLDGTLGEVLTAKPRNGWSPVCDNADAGTRCTGVSAGRWRGMPPRPQRSRRICITCPDSLTGSMTNLDGTILKTSALADTRLHRPRHRYFWAHHRDTRTTFAALVVVRSLCRIGTLARRS
jgi:hypothetical protein